MLDPTPFFVGGGAEHSPEVVRQFVYEATSGAEGVSSAGALRISALNVPGGKVNSAPGGALVNNGYPGGQGQSYSARNASQTEVAVTPTGSTGGRSDLVILRIFDPQYEGQPPADPDNFQYTRLEVVQGVPAGTKNFKSLNINTPAIALARIDLPASTATVLPAHITDLRKIAQPQVDTVLRYNASLLAETETLVETRTLGEWFPNAGGQQTIDIPAWATRMQIRGDWAQVKYLAGNAYGFMWVEYGPGVGGFGGYQDRKYKTQNFAWDTTGSNNNQRTNWLCVDDVPIPAELRGTTQTFVMKARRAGGTADTVKIDANSGVSLEVRFLEVADSSTT